MFGKSFLSLAASAGTLFGGVEAASSYSYSRVTSNGCSTAYGSGGVGPTPVPSSGGGSTVTSTIMGTPIPTWANRQLTLNSTVTVTQRTSTSATVVFATVTSPTLTVGQGLASTFATATWPKTVCTNDVSTTTVTEYQGTYVPVSGQATALPETYPTGITCSGGVMVYEYIWPYSTSGTSTTTHTPTATIFDFTTTTPYTITYATLTTYEVTETTTVTSYKVASVVPTISTACEATYTTTYAAKCAPTNLISSINGQGLLAAGHYAPGTQPSYGPDDYGTGNLWTRDASACCQLCVDNEGCAGSMGGKGQSCGLLYTPGNASVGGDVCGEFVFGYTSRANVAAGQGIVVQTGCGLIEYEA